MVKNLRFRRKKVKFWQKVLLIWHPILKTEGDPNTHDNAYYQSKSWKFLTKIDENQRKMTKNDEKKGKNDFFSSFFVIWTQKFQKIRDRGSACSRDRVFLYNRDFLDMWRQAFSNVRIEILDRDLDKNWDFRVIEAVESLSRLVSTRRDQLLKPVKIFLTVETNFLQVSRLRLSIETR
jgi:hypothetical protein